ncbi:hypothetical protein A1O3_10456 [Capronia epimyces CBS 606.96]|uniref:Phytanoyl-CoA dioxygenase n=1 Tax=Capronia epimyces CBS 606.96 TaxID=1182542 RepID=W9XAM8_9EURO|nr:uncharacterized protein A1O3_10456 [Capronia epimyces CBS 606.96]EXJ77298.1 hypothetical protein A1O3_10456 [Capronia epimyces CBS 606.96]
MTTTTTTTQTTQTSESSRLRLVSKPGLYKQHDIQYTDTTFAFRINVDADPDAEWLNDLCENGYAVVKGAIPRERAVQYQQRAFDWLRSFGKGLDLEDRSTWTAEHLPVQSKLNTFDNYCVVHEKFMWDARLEPGVIDAFTKIWGTDELLVSFDSLNVTFPGRSDKPPRAPWPHVDQSPHKRGLHCVQGIINLSHAGPEDGSLVVLPGSHKYTAEFFDTQTDRDSWPTIDWRRFSEDEMAWFASKGLKAVKVEAEPGDLIVWDSRTVHYGGEPTDKSDVVRTVIYASYAPAKLAAPEALEEKRRVFDVHGATTHWAHDNIWLRPQLAHLPDGSLDPQNRSEPLEKPELTDRLLQLAGLKPY